LPRPALSRSIVLVARKGELGNLPQRVADLSRRALREHYSPRLHALMPLLADHFAVVDEPSQDDGAP
jgi:hypothetical protein